MAKTVFSSPKEICHLWANQSQKEARTSKRSMSFSGNELYSYQTKIAELFPNHNIALVNTMWRSQTTSKHQGYLRDALPSQYHIIEVRDRFRPEGIIQHFTEHLETQIAKLKNARTPARYLVEIEKQRRNAELFLQNFSYIYKHDYTRAVEEGFYQQLTELIEAQSKFVDSADSKALAKEYTQDKEAEDKKKWEEKLIDYKKFVKAWQNHETEDDGQPLKVPNYQIPSLKGWTDIARLSKDGKVFESTRNARIPKAHGLALFHTVTDFLTRGRELKLPISIGAYTLDEVSKDGDCRLGCHYFSYAELKRIYETVADKHENETLTII